MVLEKFKVYKIFHNPYDFLIDFDRSYVLVCPERNVVIDDGFCKGKKYKQRIWSSCKYRTFDCLFIVCLDGGFRLNQATSISEDCYLEELDNNDLKDIKNALVEMGGKYRYNRKLNKITQIL